jgi:hypothetical protein
MNDCAPVAVFLYNRPEYMPRLAEAILRAKPKHLYLVFDAPDPSKPGDIEKCAKVRSQWAEFSRSQWFATIVENYAGRHMGCRDRVSSGLDWVFEREPAAIILEDDLLPNASFFDFCSAALERFRNEDHVMGVTGCNFGWPCAPDSTYCTTYSHVWGWATWARAWRFYDVRAKAWAALHGPALLDSLMRASRREMRARWARRLESVASGSIDTWDYQWQLAIWLRGGVVVGPSSNLVSNIGTGPQATHTVDDSVFLHRPTCEIELPTVWLPRETHHACDRWFEDTYFLTA